MAAPKNNEFYKLVQKPTGRPRKYTPGKLWEKAVEYFDWVATHPLYETKVFSNGRTKKIPRLRAMTEIAFCLFAEINDETFLNYKKHKEYFGVASTISKIIYQQKFEGAAADFLNANIIARDLGLKDKIDSEITGKDGGPIKTVSTITHNLVVKRCDK